MMKSKSGLHFLVVVLVVVSTTKGAPSSNVFDLLNKFLSERSFQREPTEDVRNINQLNERSFNMPKIRPSKRSMDLCDGCPHISLPSNTSCDTEFATNYKVKDKSSSCMCLSGYVCCPSTCPAIKENACFKGYEAGEDGFHYQYHPEKKNWKEAKRICKKGGGRLAVIDTDAIYKAVVSLFGNKGYFWFGLSDLNIEGDWVWVNGKKLGKSHWNPGQPDDYGGSQDCGVFNWGGIGKWDDQGYKAQHAFLCQKTSVGYFYTLKTKDCCECDASQCEQCPAPSDAAKHTCSKCFHYEKHHQKQEDTQCWESGCAEDDAIIYDVPKCDTRCQYNETNPDECGNPKTVCRSKTMPLECQPAKPQQKRCFLEPEQVFLDEFYAEDDSCKPCWKWVVEPKLEPCVQTFTTCPKDLTRVTGVSSCSQVRDTCLPCTETRCDDVEECPSGEFLKGHETDACGCKSSICETCPTSPSSCSKCQNLVTVVQVSGCIIKRCVPKACPSLTIPNCDGGGLAIRKDDCKCEQNICDRIHCPPQSGNSEFTGGMKEWKTSRYLAGKVKTTWTAARQQCQKAGGDLVSFESKEELMFVLPEAIGAGITGQNKWTSAQRIGGTNNFQWATGGIISASDPAWHGSYPSSDTSTKFMGFCSHAGCTVTNTYFNSPHPYLAFCEFKNCD